MSNTVPNIVDEIAGPEETEESIAAEEKKAAEEAAAQAAAEEATGEAGDADEAAKAEEAAQERSEMVPHAALHEERVKRQELQTQLSQTHEKIGRMEALFEKFQQENPAPGETIPDAEEDLEGHLRGSITAMQKRLDTFEQDAGQRNEHEQAQAGERQLLEQYAASVRDFSAATPDFNDAYGFLAKTVDADLIARGYDDPVERSNIMQYEEGMLVGRAMKSGKNPAELIYNYAKSRGYAGKPPGEGGEGEDDKLARLSQGAEAAQTLSGANSRGEGATTLERLAELAEEDPAAFDREWDKARRQGLLG